MDFLNNLLTAAAGYFGQEQKDQAQVQLAQLGVNPVTGAAVTPVKPATTSNSTATAGQWISGVSNGVVIASAAGLMLLVGLGVVVISTRKS